MTLLKLGASILLNFALQYMGPGAYILAFPYQDDLHLPLLDGGEVNEMLICPAPLTVKASCEILSPDFGDHGTAFFTVRWWLAYFTCHLR